MIYNPTRAWDIPATDITLPNDNGHFLYLKVPTEEGITTSELITDENHIDPLRDDGYLIYKLGYINPVVDGKREASMIWGNVRTVRQVNADWNATSGPAEILNKPYFATAFTDLTDVIDEDYIGKAWYVPRVSDDEETMELEETEELETVLAKLTELADFPVSYTGYGSMLIMTNATENGVGFVTTLPVYADNAAAITGGLVAGNIYRTSDGTMKIVY